MTGRDQRSQFLATFGTALGVAAGYYVACEVGLQLHLPGATTSILWPPNAVLTSALLLTSPRKWPFLLLAALPAHLIVELRTGWSVPFVLTLFTTNCLEALIAAGGTWLLSDAPARFDTLTRLSAFLASAVLAGPVLSSFADAAAVTFFRGEPYWTVWQTRTFSNVLSELTVVPAVVGVVSNGRRWLREGWTRRTTEALCLGIGLLAVGSLGMRGELGQLAPLRAVSTQTPLVLQLPFLLWAAVRFGPVGAGVALLATSAISAWALVDGSGPFGVGDPSTTVTALTLSLILESSTLLCLATVVQEQRQTETALRTSEVMKSAILQSLSTGVVVVDRAGTVLALNDSWTHLARQCGCASVSIGNNLLESCAASARGGNAIGRAMERGVSAVLAGSRAQVSVDHLSDPGPTPHWWSVHVVRLDAPEGGSVIALTDVTDVRRAELDAQRTREELAHVARVATIGELTASLAHQLNQPLSAILTNAQTASRLLETAGPDTSKLRAILLDIVKDDRRARDIIGRLRKLMRRGETTTVRVNLCSLVREVVDLVSADATSRGVSIHVNVGHQPAHVRGDSVQLQQLVLNLLQNAMEAVSDRLDGPRTITLRCSVTDQDAVHLVMHDSGRGLAAGAEDLIFEPFYTTKPRGMGMGLSIVRTILEAHGGSIRASNGTGGGAIFEITLPLDQGDTIPV